MASSLPYTLGLTGGIGTGKTTVSDYLEHRYHIPILDADRYARDAVAPGSVALQHIVERYGAQILLCDGTLNRAQLAEIVFTDAAERRWLDAVIHPWVRHRLETARAQTEGDAVVAMVIPLLFEAKMTDLVDTVWVVSCDPEQQLERLMQRNGLTRSQAQARIASQMPLAEKCQRADVVLENCGSLAHLYGQVEHAVQQLPLPH